MFRFSNTLFQKFSHLKGIRSKIRWKPKLAICIQRPQVIIKELSDIEKKFSEYVNRKNIDKSLLSDHELEIISSELKADKVSRHGANYEKPLVKEDHYEEEYNDFKPSSRTTDADEKNDTTSLNRKLDENLFLVTSEVFNEKENYFFPFFDFSLEVPLIRNVNAMLEQVFANPAQIISHCEHVSYTPIGFHQARYPDSMPHKEKIYGIKIFFFMMYLKRNTAYQVKVNCREAQWLEYNEIEALFERRYFRSVKPFISTLA